MPWWAISCYVKIVRNVEKEFVFSISSGTSLESFPYTGDEMPLCRHILEGKSFQTPNLILDWLQEHFSNLGTSHVCCEKHECFTFKQAHLIFDAYWNSFYIYISIVLPMTCFSARNWKFPGNALLCDKRRYSLMMDFNNLLHHSQFFWPWKRAQVLQGKDLLLKIGLSATSFNP